MGEMERCLSQLMMLDSAVAMRFLLKKTATYLEEHWKIAVQPLNFCKDFGLGMGWSHLYMLGSQKKTCSRREIPRPPLKNVLNSGLGIGIICPNPFNEGDVLMYTQIGSRLGIADLDRSTRLSKFRL